MISPYLSTKYSLTGSVSAPNALVGGRYTPVFSTCSDMRQWLGLWSLFLIGHVGTGVVRAERAMSLCRYAALSPRVTLLEPAFAVPSPSWRICKLNICVLGGGVPSF